MATTEARSAEPQEATPVTNPLPQPTIMMALLEQEDNKAGGHLAHHDVHATELASKTYQWAIYARRSMMDGTHVPSLKSDIRNALLLILYVRVAIRGLQVPIGLQTNWHHQV